MTEGHDARYDFSPSRTVNPNDSPSVSPSAAHVQSHSSPSVGGALSRPDGSFLSYGCLNTANSLNNGFVPSGDLPKSAKEMVQQLAQRKEVWDTNLNKWTGLRGMIERRVTQLNGAYTRYAEMKNSATRDSTRWLSAQTMEAVIVSAKKKLLGFKEQAGRLGEAARYENTQLSSSYQTLLSQLKKGKLFRLFTGNFRGVLLEGQGNDVRIWEEVLYQKGSLFLGEAEAITLGVEQVIQVFKELDMRITMHNVVVSDAVAVRAKAKGDIEHANKWIEEIRSRLNRLNKRRFNPQREAWAENMTEQQALTEYDQKLRQLVAQKAHLRRILRGVDCILDQFDNFYAEMNKCSLLSDKKSVGDALISKLPVHRFQKELKTYEGDLYTYIGPLSDEQILHEVRSEITHRIRRNGERCVAWVAEELISEFCIEGQVEWEGRIDTVLCQEMQAQLRKDLSEILRLHVQEAVHARNKSLDLIAQEAYIATLSNNPDLDSRENWVKKIKDLILSAKIRDVIAEGEENPYTVANVVQEELRLNPELWGSRIRSEVMSLIS